MKNTHELIAEAVADGRGVRVRLVADALGVSTQTVYQAIKRGEVRALGIGRTKRVAPEEAVRLTGIGAAA
jgi:excisionase family DNA binding protein